jgi:hypothetical protein
MVLTLMQGQRHSVIQCCWDASGPQSLPPSLTDLRVPRHAPPPAIIHPQNTSQPKVSELGGALSADQHVGRLHITVAAHNSEIEQSTYSVKAQVLKGRCASHEHEWQAIIPCRLPTDHSASCLQRQGACTHMMPLLCRNSSALATSIMIWSTRVRGSRRPPPFTSLRGGAGGRASSGTEGSAAALMTTGLLQAGE